MNKPTKYTIHHFTPLPMGEGLGVRLFLSIALSITAWILERQVAAMPLEGSSYGHRR